MVRARHSRTVSPAPIVLPLGFAALLSTIAVSAAPAAAAGLTVSPLSVAFGKVVLGAAGATSVARSERGGDGRSFGASLWSAERNA
jgi:hypothetical protein